MSFLSKFEVEAAVYPDMNRQRINQPIDQLVERAVIPAYYPDYCYEIVEIPDQNLKRLLSYQLYGNETSEICKSNLEYMTSLDFRILLLPYDNRIKDLTGLEYATYLMELTTFETEIKDFTPISQLQNLGKLEILNNHISWTDKEAYEAIGSIKSLEELSFEGHNNADFEILGQLTNLKKLKIKYNYFHEFNNDHIDSISNLINLEELDLSANSNLTDISFIQNLTKLKKLDLSRNKITDVSTLENLIKLETLRLDNNVITDIRSLANLKNIDWLSINNNQITDFSGLSAVDANGENQKIDFKEMILSTGQTFSTELPPLLDISGQPLSVSVKNCPEGSVCEIENQQLIVSGLSLGKSNVEVEFSATGISGILNYPISVIQNTKPVITAYNKILNRKDSFDPLQGVTAYDEEDGNLTSAIKVIETNVDMHKSGEYKVVYEVADNQGNVVTKEITVTVKAKVVEFKGYGVEESVREALDKYNIQITDEDMESLETLQVYDIYNLEGLEYAINLKKLQIYAWGKLDFTPIKNLSNLEAIYYDSDEDSYAPVTSLLPILSNFTNLRILSLWDCNLQDNDLGYLSGLNHLEELDLTYNSISSLWSMPQLPNLKRLILNRNKIDDLKSLNGLNSLEELDLSGNYLDTVDLEELTKFPQLQSLNLDGNNITDISFVKNLPYLKSLSFNETNVIDLSPLKDFDGSWSSAYYNPDFYLPTQFIVDGTLKIENPVTSINGEKLIPNLSGYNAIADRDYLYFTDLNESGIYLNYEYKDEKGTYRKRIIIPLKILNNPPVIKADNQTLYIGDTFEALVNVTASDVEDGNLTSTVTVVKNEVNTSQVGDYEVVYNVTDKYGITVTKTIIVSVIKSNEVPIFTGIEDLTIEGGEDFNPLLNVTAFDKEDEDLTLAIKVYGEVNTHVVGTYEIEYVVLDSDHNEVRVIRTITVVDTKAPEITLNGEAYVKLEGGDEYIELGAQVIDVMDGELDVVITGEVNTFKVGVYPITYTATDASGNTRYMERLVEIIDTTAPEITLNGDLDMTITLGSVYEELGATSSDIVDGTVKVTISGKVNVDKIGTYPINYIAQDKSGNLSIVTRLVYVTYAREDMNRDGVVDTKDLEIITDYYNVTSKNETWKAEYDFNQDGIIDLYDIVLISNQLN